MPYKPSTTYSDIEGKKSFAVVASDFNTIYKDHNLHPGVGSYVFVCNASLEELKVMYKDILKFKILEKAINRKGILLPNMRAVFRIKSKALS
jgi:hypothetical protein